MVNQLYGAFHISEDLDSTGLGDSALLATSWFDNDSTEANNFLVTPPITFTTTGNYLTFKQSHSMVLILTAQKYFISLILIKQIAQHHPQCYLTIAVPPFWTDFQVNQIQFTKFSNTFSIQTLRKQPIYSWLGNINVITGDLTSTNDLYSEIFTVYPNPSNGSIQILGLDNTQNITVNNNIGENIFSGTAALLMKQFSQGVYIIHTQNHSKLFIVNQFFYLNFIEKN